MEPIYCKVHGCRFPSTHVTASHKCGTCRNFGHGMMECGNQSLMTHLREQTTEDVMPPSKRCTVDNCQHRSTHHTDAHNCQLCYQRHSEANCPSLIPITPVVATTTTTTMTITCPLCRTVNQIPHNQPKLEAVDHQCVVCWEKNGEMVLPTCGHNCICVECLTLMDHINHIPAGNHWSGPGDPEISFVENLMGNRTGKIYLVIPTDMGCACYTRRSGIGRPIETFMMDNDDWGQYGSTTSRVGLLNQFIRGYMMELMETAHSWGLTAVQLHPRVSPNSFDLMSPDPKSSDPQSLDLFVLHNQLIEYCEELTDVTIFYDSRHPKCLHDALRVSVVESTPNSVLKSYINGIPSDLTPTTMKKYYNVPNYDPMTTPQPKIAVISLGGYYQISDLSYYWTTICQLTGILPTVIDHVVGSNHFLPPFVRDIYSLENTLDIELIGGFCPNAEIHFYSAPNTYLGYKQAFSDAAEDGMNIISTSWGQSEETFYGIGGLDAYEEVFYHAVHDLNVTIVAASGDYGSSDNNYEAITVTGYPVKVPVPHVDFPASSPSVVACGGSSLYFDNADEETAWIFGGGGQSSHFERPTYQGTWSPSWPVSPIAKGAPLAPNARTIPDVVFNADPNSPWHIYFANYDDEGAGTSACSPIMAGILGVFYAVSIPESAPRNGYFGSGFNYFLYNSPPSSFRTINLGYNITVDRDPITNAINPFGLFDTEQNTYYAIWSSAYSFCSGKGVVNGDSLFTYLNTIVCVVRGTQILMNDGRSIPIEQIQRGDLVVGYQGIRYRVAEINKQVVAPNGIIDLIEFPPDCLGIGCPSTRLMVTPNHPIIYKGARRPAKCFRYLPEIIEHVGIQAKDHLPSEPDGTTYFLYDLQFDDDGSYIANGVTLQSRSPWSDLTPLPKELYFDPTRYRKEHNWDGFNHQLPLITNQLIP